jgi:hypothetical protein
MNYSQYYYISNLIVIYQLSFFFIIPFPFRFLVSPFFLLFYISIFFTNSALPIEDLTSKLELSGSRSLCPLCPIHSAGSIYSLSGSWNAVLLSPQILKMRKWENKELEFFQGEVGYCVVSMVSSLSCDSVLCLSVSLHVSVCLSVSLYVYLTVCLPVSLSVCLSVCMCLSICLYIWLSVCVSVNQSVYQSIYLSVCLSVACLCVRVTFSRVLQCVYHAPPDGLNHDVVIIAENTEGEIGQCCERKVRITLRLIE